VGHITPKQMLRVAELADLYGRGEVRLTVWQNFIIPNVPEAFVATLKKALDKAGLPTRQSHLASGVIACTGNAYCKFAQADTKGHALELIKQLETKLALDQPVNIHVTGCPNSCAQHYMGDIGCLGTKTKINGESLDAYHVFVGGGFGKNQAVGRQVFSGVTAQALPGVIEKLLRAYLQHRVGNSSASGTKSAACRNCAPRSLGSRSPCRSTWLTLTRACPKRCRPSRPTTKTP
jgi:ferredoxin-nitrite reductase